LVVTEALRKKLHRREHGIRFVTFSCQRRLPLLGKPGARNIFVDSLYRAREKFRFPLYAWVVMPEHVHILMHATKEYRMPRILTFIKQSAAQQTISKWKDTNAGILTRIISHTGRPRFWQAGGGFDRNVRDDDEFMREVRYVHQNPVKRGLVTTPEQWEWSSVRWWMGDHKNERPCDPLPLYDFNLIPFMIGRHYM